MEIYKPIPNYPNYSVSNYGNVKNNKLDIIMSNGSKKHRYQYVNIMNNIGEHKSLSLHRIVAEAFVPNHENKPYVNHIDRNKKNNHVSNLELTTHSENIKHTIVTGRTESINNNKKNKITFNNCETKIFDSLNETAKYFDIPKGSLNCALKKNYKI